MINDSNNIIEQNNSNEETQALAQRLLMHMNTLRQAYPNVSPARQTAMLQQINALIAMYSSEQTSDQTPEQTNESAANTTASNAGFFGQQNTTESTNLIEPLENISIEDSEDGNESEANLNNS